MNQDSDQAESHVLHVDTPLGPGEQVQNQVHATWETFDDVLYETRLAGFSLQGRPVYAPPVLHPNFLTGLTSETFHHLNAQLSAWRTYVQELIAVLECGIDECDNELKLLAAQIRKHIRTNVKPKPGEKIIDDEVLTNPRMVEVTQRKQRLVQNKRLLEPYHDRYGRDLRILSRALEMRRQELGLEPGGGTIRRRVDS